MISDIIQFVGWLLSLSLPGTPKFVSDASKKIWVDQWVASLQNVNTDRFTDVKPVLRDSLKFFPTIAEVKEVIGNQNRHSNTGYDDNPGLTHYNTFNGKPIFPGFAIISKDRIAALREKDRSWDDLDKIDLSTGHIYGPRDKIRPIGSIIKRERK